MAGFLPAAVGARGYTPATIFQLQMLELPLCQSPPMPAGQIAEAEISDSNAHQMFDAVSDGLEHPPNLTIYSLSQDNAKTCRRKGTKPGNLRTLTIKKNPARQL